MVYKRQSLEHAPRDVRLAPHNTENADYTGTDPSFRVNNERLEVGAFRNRCIALSKGAFYDESLVLVNSRTNIPLKIRNDYNLRVLDTAATGATGKSLHTVIELKSEPTDPILATYQYIGGRYIYQHETITNLLESVESKDLFNIYYSQLKNRPTTFDAKPGHQHDASDVFGRDEEVAATMELVAAVRELTVESTLVEGNPTVSYLNALIVRLQREKQDAADEALNTIAKTVVGAINELLSKHNTHLNDYENPHKTTKAQVGLGNVENYGITNDISIDRTDLYVSARALKRVHDKVTEALNKSVTYWKYTARGGETEIELPYSVVAVDSVIISGHYQVRDKAWEHDRAHDKVLLGGELEAGDDVVITLGVPSLEAESIIAGLQEHINRLEQIIENGGSAPPVSVASNIVVRSVMVTTGANECYIPHDIREYPIVMVFLGGSIQTVNHGYSVDHVNHKIIFAESVNEDTQVVIVAQASVQPSDIFVA